MDAASQKQFNAKLIEEFRRNGGQVESMPNANLILLTTTGRKSGQPYTVPLGNFEIEGQLVAVASNIGSDISPDWYENLVVNPEVTVEVAGETYRAEAIVPQGAERDELFTKLVAEKPFFHEHQQKTERIIPVVVLKRLPEAEVANRRGFTA